MKAVNMAIVCPSVMAASEEQYKRQMERIAHFAHRIQVDLTDGIFAEPKTITAKQAWWPVGMQADVHIMHKDPEEAARIVAEHNPNMIIVHAEADGDFSVFAHFCREKGIKVGVALLQKTEPDTILPALELVDHVLIFAGELGHYAGQADLSQLDKVEYLKQHKPNLEVGWDGGINDQNISQLAFAGVDVFNVGGFIQKAENPEKAFHALQRIADETGET
jgi:ribulose-phosphate 3-epimerase